MHGPVWHYLFEVGHFHYMIDEHILEHSSFETLCIPVCSPSHTRAYPPSLGSSNLSKASLSFNLIVDPHELSYWGISPPIEFACIVILVILWLWAT